MKLTTVSSIVSLANIAYAATIVLNSDAMQYFGDANDAGVRLNLDERRLVQLHPDHQPVWMTEQEKVRSSPLSFQSPRMTHALADFVLDPGKGERHQFHGHVNTLSLLTITATC
jgi:hypothetical protein